MTEIVKDAVVMPLHVPGWTRLKTSTRSRAARRSGLVAERFEQAHVGEILRAP